MNEVHARFIFEPTVAGYTAARRLQNEMLYHHEAVKTSMAVTRAFLPNEDCADAWALRAKEIGEFRAYVVRDADLAS